MSKTINVRISDNLDYRLDSLASSMNCSKSDVLRRGIGLLEVMVEADRKNQKLCVLDEKDTVVSRITSK